MLLRNLLQKNNDIAYIDVVDNLCNCSGPFLDEFPSCVNFVFSDVATWSPSRTYSEIYHLASPVGPAGVLKYAGRMGPMIIADTYKMACIAESTGARLIDISTSEVYGQEPGSIAQREDIDKVVPSDITIRLEYGVAKLASEVSLINMAKITNLQVNIIRPFNIVGPSQSGEVGFVLPRFIDQALNGKPLTVFGDGTQKRTFTSVDDFTNAIQMVMESDVSSEIFNIGNPANICSVLDLGKTVIRLTGSDSQLEFIDPREIYGSFYAEAWNKIPNIDKVTSKIGWLPKEDIDTIVLKAITVARQR